MSAWGCAFIFLSPFLSLFLYLSPVLLPTESEERVVLMSALSPSGSTKAENVGIYWSRAIVHIATKELILSGKFLPGGKSVVLGFDGEVFSMEWLDETTLHVSLSNRTYIGRRVRDVGGIKILVSFKPDDADARRRQFEDRKVPVDEWWKYDISP
jgi:hypothetical protein